MMGGHALFLGPNDIGIGKREAIKDISRLFSRYNDVIMARLFDHQHIVELAEYADIPVINGLTDYNHPCQIMTDILTVWEHRGNLDNLKVCYMGDGNNIVNSWLQLATRFSMHFVCCGPEGYEPDSETVNMVNDSDLSSYELSHDPLSAVKDADIIYTDVWASMGQKEEAEEREKIFAPFQVNRTLIESTGKDTLFMHCLPAERGREVTDSVMESSNSIVFDQAERSWSSRISPNDSFTVLAVILIFLSPLFGCSNRGFSSNVVIIVCKRLAPMFSIFELTSDAIFAIARIDALLNSSCTFSALKSAVYCLINADLGWVNIFIKSSIFNLSSSTLIGNRPWSSGIISDGALT